MHGTADALGAVCTCGTADAIGACWGTAGAVTVWC